MINNEKFWQKIIDAIQGNPFSGIWALAAFLCVAVYTAGSTSAANLVSSIMGAGAGISVGSAIAYKWWSKATHREEALENREKALSKREKELEEREARTADSIKQREDKIAEREGVFNEATQMNLELQRNISDLNYQAEKLNGEIGALQEDNHRLQVTVGSTNQAKDQTHDFLGQCIAMVEQHPADGLASNTVEMHQGLKNNLVQAQRMLRG